MHDRCGTILRINLKNEKIKHEKISRERRKMFLGGDGLAASYVFDEIGAGADPLGPANKLIVAVGALSGTGMTSCNRFEVAAKSPLTNIYGEACAGGFWGPALRSFGCEGIIIEEVSPHPVYLLIGRSGCSLRKAGHLWGKDTIETVKELKRELGDEKIKVLLIGQAGENKVSIAAVVDDEGHAAGRTGMGAVMGSKKLKALVVQGGGKEKPEAADSELLRSVNKIIRERMRENQGIENFTKYGTAGDVINAESLGDMPIKNWTLDTWTEGASLLSGRQLAEKYLTKRKTCFACPVGCKRVVEVKTGLFAVEEGHGPEYETLASLGTLLLNDNLEAVIKMNDLCTRYGLDTISCGAVIAFAIECSKKGLLKPGLAGPFTLKYGDAPGHIEVIEAIAFKKGLGEILGRGVKAAAMAIGAEKEEGAIHVKGLELPMHDPRAKDSFGLSYATSNRGACHVQSNAQQVEGGIIFPELGFTVKLDRLTSKGKAPVVAKTQHLSLVLDAIGMCRLPVAAGAITVTDIARGLSAFLGREISVEDLDKTGERIFNLKRCFNIAAGISRRDDTLPQRILKYSPEGISKWHYVELEEQLEQYYRIRGWDEKGIPKQDTLKRLGLDNAAGMLKERAE